MNLLKLLGEEEILKVYGVKEARADPLGIDKIYHRGTKRIVRKYLLFPKKFNGISIGGDCVIMQTASFKIGKNGDTEYHAFNVWINDVFLEHFDPKKDYKRYKLDS